METLQNAYDQETLLKLCRERPIFAVYIDHFERGEILLLEDAQNGKRYVRIPDSDKFQPDMRLIEHLVTEFIFRGRLDTVVVRAWNGTGVEFAMR